MLRGPRHRLRTGAGASDAGMWIDGSDPDLTTLEMRQGVARDLHILPRGNVAAPGEVAPRHFLSVLAKSDRGRRADGRPCDTPPRA
jgi:hypothetical protein